MAEVPRPPVVVTTIWASRENEYFCNSITVSAYILPSLIEFEVAAWS